MVLLEVSGIAKVLPKQKLEAWLASSLDPARGSPVTGNLGPGSVCPITSGAQPEACFPLLSWALWISLGRKLLTRGQQGEEEAFG